MHRESNNIVDVLFPKLLKMGIFPEIFLFCALFVAGLLMMVTLFEYLWRHNKREPTYEILASPNKKRTVYANQDGTPVVVSHVDSEDVDSEDSQSDKESEKNLGNDYKEPSTTTVEDDQSIQ